jgi:hypothetical protein
VQAPPNTPTPYYRKLFENETPNIQRPNMKSHEKQGASGSAPNAGNSIEPRQFELECCASHRYGKVARKTHNSSNDIGQLKIPRT